MRITYLLGVFTAITSCFLMLACEKEIDLKAQTPPSQLYANCILNPDSVFQVYLSYSTPITASREEIENKLQDAVYASVVIKDENDQVIDSLRPYLIYYGYVPFLTFRSPYDLRPIPNKNYKLHVTEPYFSNRKNRPISAITSIPKEISGIRAKKHVPQRDITGEDETFGISLKWKDPNPQAKNFFIIEAIYKHTDLAWPYYPFLSRSELYSIESENDNQEIGKKTDKFLYIFIDDSKLPTKQNSDSISTQIGVLTETFDQWRTQFDSLNSTTELLINVHHANKALYEYYKDVEKYRINTNSTDIFAQPIHIRGNMQSGLGFFGGECIQQAILSY